MSAPSRKLPFRQPSCLTRSSRATSMTLSATQFRLGVETSPTKLHGLSHREIGDFSDCPALLIESPEPFLDRVRGISDEALLLTERDEFVMQAGAHKLLYWPIDANGWPIDTRVARHCTTVQTATEMWTKFHKDLPIVVSGLPSYTDLIKNKIGHCFRDPGQVASSLLAWE